MSLAVQWKNGPPDKVGFHWACSEDGYVDLILITRQSWGLAVVTDEMAMPVGSIKWHADAEIPDPPVETRTVEVAP